MHLFLAPSPSLNWETGIEADARRQLTLLTVVAESVSVLSPEPSGVGLKQHTRYINISFTLQLNY